MSEIEQSIATLARRDGRFHLDAYLFVFDALAYARDTMHLIGEEASEEEAQGDEDVEERHLTGQQLCEAIRRLALEQFGYMAKLVFNQWGVTKSGDFGHIVFNLIEIGQMRKRDSDRREDFDDVFDFDRDLVAQYRISSPD